MKIVLVSYHLPDPRGTAAGRILYATCDGLINLGHEVQVRAWSDAAPADTLPSWCTWVPLQRGAGIGNRLRSLLRPRDETATADLDLPDDAILVADDPVSFPAVRRHPGAVLTVPNLTELDVVAIRRLTAGFVQHIRAERRVSRQARPFVLVYSERVRRRLGTGVVLPVAYPVPARPVPPVAEPVGACLADWLWPPNQRALETLLRAWPDVRRQLPTARLLLGGRGLEQVGVLPGVEVLGVVGDSTQVLSRAASLVFPCPASSGPKVKTLEALALGLPVVTTMPGLEGIHPAACDGAIAAQPRDFVAAVTGVLADAELRARMAAAGRAGTIAHHAPLPAAGSRIEILEELHVAMA